MHDGQHRWIVDSIEERAAKEGDVLSVQHDRPAKGQRSTLTIAVDAAATKKALAESAAQVKKGAPPKGAGGDIIL